MWLTHSRATIRKREERRGVERRGEERTGQERTGEETRVFLFKNASNEHRFYSKGVMDWKVLKYILFSSEMFCTTASLFPL